MVRSHSHSQLDMGAFLGNSDLKFTPSFILQFMLFFPAQEDGEVSLFLSEKCFFVGWLTRGIQRTLRCVGISTPQSVIMSPHQSVHFLSSPTINMAVYTSNSSQNWKMNSEFCCHGCQLAKMTVPWQCPNRFTAPRAMVLTAWKPSRMVLQKGISLLCG